MHFNIMKIVVISFSIMTSIEAAESSLDDSFWMWVAIFALATVGILILYISSRQTRNIEKLHQSMLHKQIEMEKNQNLLLTTMSENIHTIAKQALEQSHRMIVESTDPIADKEEILASVESRLLDVTNDLIDFLRLKSKKIEINNAAFNINNVLNEISGTVCSQFLGSKSELIFDIDKNVPRRLVGDSLHLGQIINAVLEYQMDQPDVEEVRLEISMYNTFEDKVELQFKFSDIGAGLEVAQVEKMFTPYYNEESGTYIGLGLFVAHELVTMMDGEISVESIVNRGSTFTLSLPFSVVDKKNKRMYRLPNKELIEKKVFIVDTNYHAALAIKKMFAYFKHEVKVLTKDDFLRNIPNLMPYDIVVLNESLFSSRLVEYLNKIKIGKELKVIALNTLLRPDKQSFVDSVIDVHLFKPLNQERIFEMIVNMYDQKIIEPKENKKQSLRAKVHKSDIVETENVTQERFQDFKGKNILIVEDNLINQKVLTNLFRISGMHISIANNGQEAVELVKEGMVEYDLILMDINMPIMDGYTATQMIRLDSKYDKIPIVAFTALVLDSEMDKMFQSGINAFLAKPLNIGKLYSSFAMYIADEPIVQPEKREVKPKEIVHYDGINIEKGIHHANNSEALYLEVLKEFSMAYGQSDKTFVGLINEHRYEQLRMLCVDMRGLSGSIGAEDMQALVAEILQQILYKKYELLANYREKYIFEIKTLNKSIQKYIHSI